MSKITTNQGIEEMERSLRFQTESVANELDIEIPKNISSGDIFSYLVKKLAKKHKQRIVFLLDEYDNPYTDFVNDPAMAEKVRNLLRNYYVQIKASDEYLKFVFITGISKFAKMGVFSTLNNITDISLNPKYAEICGLTEEEIIKYFPDYLQETAEQMNISTEELIAKMRHYYNGFSFDYQTKTKLYNPYSCLLFFLEKAFFNYWIDTGSSRMLADYLKNKNLTIEEFRNFVISRDFAKNPGEVDKTPAHGFLYQAGYLTLRAGISEDTLCLDYPNTEVLNSMSELFIQNILQDVDDDFTYCRTCIIEALNASDYQMFIETLNRLLASIPYDDFYKTAERTVYKNKQRERKYTAVEWIYRSTILAFLRGCGFKIFAEMHSNKGRSDIIIFYSNKAYVIELKLAYEGENPANKAAEALKQIIENNYAKPYPNAICIGMAIEDSKRQITEFIIS